MVSVTAGGAGGGPGENLIVVLEKISSVLSGSDPARTERSLLQARALNDRGGASTTARRNSEVALLARVEFFSANGDQ